MGICGAIAPKLSHYFCHLPRGHAEPHRALCPHERALVQWLTRIDLAAAPDAGDLAAEPVAVGITSRGDFCQCDSPEFRSALHLSLETRDPFGAYMLEGKLLNREINVDDGDTGIRGGDLFLKADSDGDGTPLHTMVARLYARGLCVRVTLDRAGRFRVMFQESVATQDSGGFEVYGYDLGELGPPISSGMASKDAVAFFRMREGVRGSIANWRRRRGRAE